MENKQEANYGDEAIKRLIEMDPNDVQEAGRLAFFGILKRAETGDKDYREILEEVTSNSLNWTLGQIIDLIGQDKGLSFDNAKEYILQTGFTEAVRDNERALDLFLHNDRFAKAIKAASVDFDQKVAEGVKAHLEKLEKIKKAKKKVKGEKLGPLITLPAHNLTSKMARHLDGLEVAPCLDDGSVEIKTETRDGKVETAALIAYPGEHIERAYEQDAALLLNSEMIKPIIDRAFQEHTEIKAKTFLGALSLATMSETPTLFRIDLRDFMAALGYDRKNTRKDYYDKHFASVIKTLERDLASIKADITSYDGKGNQVHYRGRLMTLWGYEGEQIQLPGNEITKAMVEALREDDESAWIEVVKKNRPTVVKIGFDPDILAAFGIRTGRDTTAQLIPRQILEQKGPAFWLALNILPMLRWSKGKELQPNQGVLLMKELTDLGYIADHTRGGKEYISDALRAWASDTGIMVDIGILENSGSGYIAHSYDQETAGWKDVTSDLSKLIQGGRVTRSYLATIRIIYELPLKRIAERKDVTQRRDKITGKKKATKKGG